MGQLFRTWFKSWFSDNAGQFENDYAKIRIVKSGDWENLIPLLHAECISACAQSASAKSSNSAVAPGSVAYCSQWLESAGAASWSCSFCGDSSAAKLRAFFFPTTGGIKKLGDGEASGTFKANNAGL